MKKDSGPGIHPQQPNLDDQPHPNDWEPRMHVALSRAIQTHGGLDDEPPTRPDHSAARATVRRIRELEELVVILQARIAHIKAGGL
jgi:hypothetical protein